MKKHLLTILASLMMAGVSFARSPAATQDWVASYVSNQVASIAATIQQTKTNNVNTVSISENGTNIVATVEDPTVVTLILDNCAEALTNVGITNRMYFPYVDNGMYRNGLHIIQATATNLVLNATHQSAEVDGHAYFFDAATNRVASIKWTYLQPSVAATFTTQK